jgi:hypothetical protein
MAGKGGYWGVGIEWVRRNFLKRANLEKRKAEARESRVHEFRDNFCEFGRRIGANWSSCPNQFRRGFRFIVKSFRKSARF